MSANLENSAVATGLEKVSFQFSKKGNAKECSNYCTIALISHASKVMLKILQARLQQYMNREIPDVQAGGLYNASRCTRRRNQRSNCQHLLDHRKSKRFQKNICFIDCAKAFNGVNHNKLWKIVQEMGVLDHFICLLRNLYAG